MGLRARRRTVVVWRSSRGQGSRHVLREFQRPASTQRLRGLLRIGWLLAAIAVIWLGRALRLRWAARLTGLALIVTGVVVRGDLGAVAFLTGFLFLYAALVIRVRPLADRERRLALERELADYSPGERGDLEAILDRYSDGDTSEMRDILTRQAVATRDNGVPGIGRLPVNPR